MAAPLGNTNAKKENRMWADAIRKAIAQGKPERLRLIAESLLAKAEEGDIQAIKELGDRLDGKAAQTLDVNTDISLLNILHALQGNYATSESAREREECH